MGVSVAGPDTDPRAQRVDTAGWLLVGMARPS